MIDPGWKLLKIVGSLILQVSPTSDPAVRRYRIKHGQLAIEVSGPDLVALAREVWMHESEWKFGRRPDFSGHWSKRC